MRIYAQTHKKQAERRKSGIISVCVVVVICIRVQFVFRSLHVYIFIMYIDMFICLCAYVFIYVSVYLSMHTSIHPVWNKKEYKSMYLFVHFAYCVYVLIVIYWLQSKNESKQINKSIYIRLVELILKIDL